MNPISTNTEMPSWCKEEGITERLDARGMLSKGEHPMEIVLKAVHELPKGAIYELITPFPPTPLIEKVMALGLDSYSKPVSGNEFHTYFYKP